MQAVCDHNGIFTDYNLGWPGCVQDSTVFKLSDVWIERSVRFGDEEFILVDKGYFDYTIQSNANVISGYPLTKFSIRPFADYDLTSNPVVAERRKKWNHKLSSLRISVEHAFGRLKGRFPYLREIRGADLTETYCVIEALFVLHNILEGLHDDPMEIDDFVDELEEYEENVEARQADQNLGLEDLFRAGDLHRKALVNLM